MNPMNNNMYGSGNIINPYMNVNMINGGMNYNNRNSPSNADDRMLSNEQFNHSLLVYDHEEKKHLKKGGFFSVSFSSYNIYFNDNYIIYYYLILFIIHFFFLML